MKRCKPEPLLSEAFKAIKPGYLLRSLDENITPLEKAVMKVYENNKYKPMTEICHGIYMYNNNFYSVKHETFYKYAFDWAKPILNLSRRESIHLRESLKIIKLKRKFNSTGYDRGWWGVNRIYPLSQEKYDEFAKLFFLKKCATKKKIISEIRFGNGEIKTNGKYGKDRVIHKRTVGIRVGFYYEKRKIIFDIPH